MTDQIDQKYNPEKKDWAIWGKIWLITSQETNYLEKYFPIQILHKPERLRFKSKINLKQKRFETKKIWDKRDLIQKIFETDIQLEFIPETQNAYAY